MAESSTQFSCKMRFSKSSAVLALYIQIGILVAGTRLDENPCPRSRYWVQANLVDMGCLLLNSTTTYTWEQAYLYCLEEENASLVEIQTEEQVDFLKMELYVV